MVTLPTDEFDACGFCTLTQNPKSPEPITDAEYISEIYLADNFLTDSFGFAVSVSKQNASSFNSQIGKISNIRHYIFP